MVRALLKSKFSEASQGPVLQAALSKDSSQGCYVNSAIQSQISTKGPRCFLNICWRLVKSTQQGRQTCSTYKTIVHFEVLEETSPIHHGTNPESRCSLRVLLNTAPKASLSRLTHKLKYICHPCERAKNKANRNLLPVDISVSKHFNNHCIYVSFV